MKKLRHYPTVWQAYPFSMEMFAHFEQEAKLQNQEVEKAKAVKKKERRPRFKLAFTR